MPRIGDAISTRTSTSAGGGCAVVFLYGFLGLFVLAGVAAGVFLSIWPLYQAFRARAWTPTPCEVISSRVVHSDESARPEIVYRYVVDDRVYTADRYDFLPGSNSDAERYGAVATHAPGTRFECYVDPDDPKRAVINRTPTAWYFFGLAFMAMFAGIPGGILWLIARPPRIESAMAGSRPMSKAAALLGHDGLVPRFDAPSGPLVLTPAVTPMGKLVGAIVVCLFWNGIVAVPTYYEVRAILDGHGAAWAIGLFLLLFQGVGLFLVGVVVQQLLALANPRPILTLSRGTLPLGTAVPFTWQLTGAAHRVTQLTITLRGREEAKYRQGTDTKTDTHDFHTQTLVDTSQAMTIARGSGVIAIPAGSMHSFAAAHNKVIWTLQIAGSIPRWPDLDESFDITVLPT
jgi:hypothetical protein